MRINNWQLNTALSSLVNIKNGEIRRLGEYQMKLLLALIESPDEVLSRSYLTNKVWCNRFVGPNSLPVAMTAIRQAIDDQGDIIRTITKRGYILDSSYLKKIYLTDREVESERSQHIIMCVNNTTYLMGDREKIIPLVMSSIYDKSVLH